MIFIGVDIGITGAIAVIEGDTVDLYDIPTRLKKGKSKVRREINPVETDWIIRKYCRSKMIVCVEDISARPGQGVSSMFSLGHSLGVIEGLAAYFGAETVKVRPQEWKRHYGLIGGSKDDSLEKARELFPKLEKELKRNKDHNRADALLLANWIKVFY